LRRIKGIVEVLLKKSNRNIKIRLGIYTKTMRKISRQTGTKVVLKTKKRSRFLGQKTKIAGY
jgi:hypothetical protein